MPALSGEVSELFMVNACCLLSLWQSLKPEGEPLEETTERLPILADMILYYCRFAARPVLLQVYQTEVGWSLAPMWSGRAAVKIHVLPCKVEAALLPSCKYFCTLLLCKHICVQQGVL